MNRLLRSKQETGIDISPLIDMVFILLIFFMVTTTFVKDMKLELDAGVYAGAQKCRFPVDVSIRNTRTDYFSG